MTYKKNLHTRKNKTLRKKRGGGKEIDNMRVDELRKELSKYDLPTKGKKETLVKRLKKYLADLPASGEPASAPAASAEHASAEHASAEHASGEPASAEHASGEPASVGASGEPASSAASGVASGEPAFADASGPYGELLSSYDAPTRAPQSPPFAPQSPPFAPQSPSYDPQSPSYDPQSPSYAPQPLLSATPGVGSETLPTHGEFGPYGDSDPFLDVASAHEDSTGYPTPSQKRKVVNVAEIAKKLTPDPPSPKKEESPEASESYDTQSGSQMSVKEATPEATPPPVMPPLTRAEIKEGEKDYVEGQEKARLKYIRSQGKIADEESENVHMHIGLGNDKEAEDSATKTQTALNNIAKIHESISTKASLPLKTAMNEELEKSDLANRTAQHYLLHSRDVHHASSVANNALQSADNIRNAYSQFDLATVEQEKQNIEQATGNVDAIHARFQDTDLEPIKAKLNDSKIRVYTAKANAEQHELDHGRASSQALINFFTNREEQDPSSVELYQHYLNSRR